MELTTLKNHIKTKKFDPFYIFTGPEIEVMRIYINQMVKVNNAVCKNLGSAEELIQKLNNRSMLQNAFIYILYDCKEFISNENLQSKIEHYKAHNNTIILFVYSNIDKRAKLYKNMQDHIITFEYLKPNILTKYIQKEVDLSDTNCAKLIDICENDYSRILLEVDKLKCYQGIMKSGSTDRLFNQMINDGTIYSPPTDAVFDFVDAMLRDKPNKAYSLLKESYGCGEATMVLLSNLYNSAKQLLQVQSYTGDDTISNATGLTPFQVKLANGRKHIFSNGDLVYLMKLIQKVESGIKIGEIEEPIAVEYILTKFWLGD